MKGPKYLTGIPTQPGKGKKRSAEDLSKSKVGESSKAAESKKTKADPVVAAPPVSVNPPSLPAVTPLPSSTAVGPSSAGASKVLPPPSLVIPRSHSWSKGIIEELSIPPVPLLEADLRDIQTVGNAHLRGAESAADLKRARMERDETLKQWQKASNEFQAGQVKLEKVEYELQQTREIFADANVMIATLKEAQADDEKELKAMTSERDRIKAEGEASSSTLAAEIARLQGLLQESVEEAFKNLLAQIQVLNPGVELNTAGHHFRSYVEGNQLVAFVEPLIASETRLDGDASGVETEKGEEASTALQPAS